VSVTHALLGRAAVNCRCRMFGISTAGFPASYRRLR
jgi:hypothetical protein